MGEPHIHCCRPAIGWKPLKTLLERFEAGHRLYGGHMLHRDLQKVYNQLVVGGVLSEAEFWKGRQNLIRQRIQGTLQAKQQPGFKSEMIAEQAADGGNQKVLHLIQCSCVLVCNVVLLMTCPQFCAGEADNHPRVAAADLC
jgi:hypothetical protein